MIVEFNKSNGQITLVEGEQFYQNSVLINQLTVWGNLTNELLYAVFGRLANGVFVADTEQILLTRNPKIDTVTGEVVGGQYQWQTTFPNITTATAGRKAVSLLLKVPIDSAGTRYKLLTTGIFSFSVSDSLATPDFKPLDKTNVDILQGEITDLENTITIVDTQSIKKDGSVAFDIGYKPLTTDLQKPATVQFVLDNGGAGNSNFAPYIGTNGNWFEFKTELGTFVDTGAKAQGAQGSTGATGIQGIQGNKGDTGAQGVAGVAGVQGQIGPKGDKGDIGLTGAKGLPGDTPIIGANENWFIGGIDTAKPSRGAQGIPGVKGDKGDKGDQGIQGIQGERGLTGATGQQGIQGERGGQGAQGIQGVQGPIGNKGDQGIAGPKGDAMQIVAFYTSIAIMDADFSNPDIKKNDFVGINSNDTADDGRIYYKGAAQWVYWTTFKGIQGQKGDIGPKGQKGDQGIQGIEGIQGVKGATGGQGPTGATGLKGDKGDIGLTGAKGDNGATYIPTVTQEGNISWANDKGLVNPSIVNIKGQKGDPGAAGPKGDKGDIGAQGQKGDIGPKGDKGDIGATGIQGIQGAKGDTGAQGVAGIAGAQGQIGPKGEQGIQGIQGATGAKGNTGATGAKGDVGLIGPKGDTGATGPAGPLINATATTIGGVKARLNGTTLYMTTNGNNA